MKHDVELRQQGNVGGRGTLYLLLSDDMGLTSEPPSQPNPLPYFLKTYARNFASYMYRVYLLHDMTFRGHPI